MEENMKKQSEQEDKLRKRIMYEKGFVYKFY